MLKSVFRIQFVLVALLFACSEDGEKKSSSYSFKEQELSGEIEGNSWAYEDGFVEESSFDDEEILDIRLFLEQDEPACETFQREGDEVFFFVPNAVGLYKLGLGEDIFDGQTITLFDDEETNNIIASEGAVEILTITDTEVTGRIDARYDGDNYINGNFTVSFCPGI